MKTKKQILTFLFLLLALGVLECALTPLFSYLSEEVSFGVYVVTLLSRLLAVCAPFLTLGVASDAISKRGFSYGLLFVGIYAGVSLLFRVPLSLITYDPIETSTPYALSLLFYMLSALLTALILLASLVLGNLLFLQKEAPRCPKDTPLLSLASAPSRVCALCAGMLTLYLLTTEVIDIISYAKDKLYILSGEDVFDFIFFILCILLSGLFAFVVGRVAERRLRCARAL